MTAAVLHVVPPAAPMPGHLVLNEIRDTIDRHAVFPNIHCAPMIALWCAHTWAAEWLYTTPRLLLSSAEPASGKTRVLELIKHFARAPEMTMSGSAAALVRMVAAGPITILLDEVDTIFAGGGAGSEDVRGMLNGGYKRTATIPKVKGDAGSGFVVERLPIFAPAALAGLAGCFPDTITTRAITVHLRKRRNDQDVDSYVERRFERDAAPVRETLAQWVNDASDTLIDAEPVMPDGVRDRSAEIWEPLLALADAAGNHWPVTGRAACSAFVHYDSQIVPSQGVRLLSDLRDLYRERATDRLHTSDILMYLNDREDAPWAEYRNGRPLNSRQLAELLAKYYVAPIGVEINGKNTRGYVTHPTSGQREQVGLADAWARYLNG